MRILLVHNHYQQPGGEDHVFAAESLMLESFGHHVFRYTLDNRIIGRDASLGVASSAVWNRAVYRDVRSLIGVHRPDVVHFHNTFPLVSPSAYYAARAKGVPVVQTLHNYRLLCPGATFFRDGKICEDCLHHGLAWPAVVHGCYRGSRRASLAVTTLLSMHRAAGTWTHAVDRYIALTEFARGKFVDAGFPGHKISVKPNFVHPDPLPGDGAGDYAIFVGRLTPEKGLGTLLKAWEKLPNAIPLKIVGDGPLAGQVAAARSASVQWLGRRPARETYDLIGRARVLIFPSEWYETFGLVAIEAFAKGTPVIASRLGAMAELVEDERTGLLFKAGDADELAGAVERFFSSPAMVETMRGEVRREFEEKYTAAVNHEMMMELYDSLLASPVGCA